MISRARLRARLIQPNGGTDELESGRRLQSLIQIWLAPVSLRPGGLAGLAAFWPPKDAQRCLLLRTNEHCFGSSAAERAGIECA